MAIENKATISVEWFTGSGRHYGVVLEIKKYTYVIMEYLGVEPKNSPPIEIDRKLVGIIDILIK